MQGAFKLHNSTRAANEVVSQELLFTLAANNDIEPVTADPNIYFQKLWIYPGKGVNASTGVLTNNGADVYVGKSGSTISFTPESVTYDGSIALVTKTNHGLIEGDNINATGATPSTFNRTGVRIFDVQPNSFKYQLASAPTALPSVMPTFARAQYCPDKLSSTDLPIKYELPLGQKMRLNQVIVTGAAGDGVFLQWS